ncbi:MAG: hypothetical protein IJF15_02750 [Oscillospiraceae bacterium]|nr:hypothetical protein [Oscillospiraceae bacterium]
MRRKIFAALFAAALPLLFPLSALAAPEDGEQVGEPSQTVETTAPPDTAADTSEQIGFSGEIDPRTGLPISDGSGALSGVYMASDSSFSYDMKEKRFVNRIGDNSFESNVPNGAVLPYDAVVYIDLPTGLDAVLYRNGDSVDDVSPNKISGEGSYVLDVRSGSSGTSSYFSFVIMPEITNTVREIVLPSDFSFDYIYLNDAELSPDFSNSFTLRGDGAYRIAWSCEQLEERFELSFLLDTAAPTIELTGVSNGEASSPVTLTGLEDDAYVLVTHNDRTLKITGIDYTLETPGEYHLTVCDMAGNSTPYSFIIHVYLDMSAGAAIALVAAILSALGIYCYRVRRHPRVG